MKLAKVVMLGAMLSVAGVASAQFSNTSSSSRNVVANSDACASYNRISLSYENTGLTANKQFGDFIEDEDHISMNGFGVQYLHGFSLSRKLPMFIEVGGKLSMVFGSNDGEEVEIDDEYMKLQLKTQLMSLSVPVNYSYKFAINDKFAISPYVGLNFKLHLLGRMKNHIDASIDIEDYIEDYEENWVNIFSDDDEDGMGDSDYTFNRFQMGWHVGVGFQISKLYLGVQYGTDFIPAYSYKKAKVNSGNLAVSVGINI